MAPKNLQEIFDQTDTVELLRNSQLGAYIYPVVPPSSRTGAASSAPGAIRPCCTTSPTTWSTSSSRARTP